MDLSEAAILAMKKDDLVNLCRTLKIPTNNTLTKSAMHALIKQARDAKAKVADPANKQDKNIPDPAAAAAAVAAVVAAAAKSKAIKDGAAAIDAALALSIKSMQEKAAADKASLGELPPAVSGAGVKVRRKSPTRPEGKEDDSETDDEEASVKSRKRHRAERSERKMSDIEYDMFAALADVLHKDLEELLDVVQRWANKQVALNPAMWLAMFALHPVSFSEIQEAETGLEGQLVRQLRQIWEVRFPSATTSEIAAIIRNWTTAYDTWCAALSRESSVNWVMFLERQAAPLKSWNAQMALLQDRELRLIFQGPTVQALQQRRGVQVDDLMFGDEEALNKIIAKGIIGRGQGHDLPAPRGGRAADRGRGRGRGRGGQRFDTTKCGACGVAVPAGQDYRKFFVEHNKTCIGQI